MGFFDVEDVIGAFKSNQLESKLQEYDLNDLVLLHKELEGYAKKHNRLDELKDLLAIVANKLAEEQKKI